MTARESNYDPAQLMDGIQQLTEFLSGLRNALMREGFSSEEAGQICVQQHLGIMQHGPTE